MRMCSAHISDSHKLCIVLDAPSASARTVVVLPRKPDKFQLSSGKEGEIEL